MSLQIGNSFVLDPISVALKFGFLAVLYFFILWVVKSVGKDLRETPAQAQWSPQTYDDATGMFTASAPYNRQVSTPTQLRSVQSGVVLGLDQLITLGRSDQATLKVQDQYASHNHARISPQGDLVLLEDLGSTNGTYLNGDRLEGPRPLHVGDSVRIGDFELLFEQ